MGNNISETYPRRIGQGINDAPCILKGARGSRVKGRAWKSTSDDSMTMRLSKSQDDGSMTTMCLSKSQGKI